jgi:hypothetical protein
MPTWLKVVLIVVAVGFLALVAVAFLGYRWMKSHGGELKADAEKIKVEATAFGRGKDANACIDETFARMNQCSGIMCDVKSKLFLQNCLAVAEVPSGFCASVPKPTEIIATAQWTIAECGRRGRPNDQRCPRVITALQDACVSTR